MFANLRRRMIRQNRIYIMPSGRGFLFLSAVVVMILTAATYNNNLIFILAFFMFALFVVSMLQTHYNLKGIRLEYVGSEDGFEGERLPLLFHVTQQRRRLKRNLEVRASSKTFRTLQSGMTDLDRRESFHAVRVEVFGYRRGFHALPEMILETYFPVGLFRAWKVFRLPGELVVYPKPQGEAPPVLGQQDQGEEETGLRTTPDGDFGELKGYQTGESYHQIAWKQFARSGSLYTKVHWGAEHKHYALPWAPPADVESYLRQMSRWIQVALDEDASFEIETPNVKIEAGRGAEQAKLCWRALAAVKESA
jgi:uncharacterized protein (DUF58 family)